MRYAIVLVMLVLGGCGEPNPGLQRWALMRMATQPAYTPPPQQPISPTINCITTGGLTTCY